MLQGKWETVGLLLGAGLLAAGSLVACQLPGPQFVVTTTMDAPDVHPGDGICEATAGSGDCTLRAAVMEANAVSGTADIEVGDGNTYVLTRPGSDDNTGVADDLDIAESVSINGHSTVDGNFADSVFDVHAGTLFLDGLTITHGRALLGGGIHVRSGAGLNVTNTVFTLNIADSVGGAINNEGSAVISDSQVLTNIAEGTLVLPDEGPNVPAFGGGIATSGALTVTRSTIADNVVSVTGAGSAIWATGSARVDIESSTVHANGSPTNFSSARSAVEGTASTTATIRQSTIDEPAAPNLLEGSSFTIVGSTLVAGTGPYGPGNVVGPDTTATLAGAALQSPGAVCAPRAHVTSNQYNAASDATCGLQSTGDLQSAALNLGPLTNHGGTTQTRLPQVGSPLIDKIPPNTADLCASGAVDQRGVSRPAGTSCDIGSVERANS